jgi:hypothetical protein
MSGYSDIVDHFLTRRVGREVAVDKVGDRPSGAVVLGQARPPRPRLARHQALVTHDGADQLEPGWDTPTAQLGMYPTVAVGLVGIGEDLHDQRRQLRPPTGGRRHFTTFPVEKS